MKPDTRIPPFAAVSLLVCLACLTLWTRSYFYAESVASAARVQEAPLSNLPGHEHDAPRVLVADSYRGRVRLAAVWPQFGRVPWWRSASRMQSDPIGPGFELMDSSTWSGLPWSFAGVEAGRTTSGAFYSYDPMRALIAPWWLPTLLAAIAPAVWLGRWWRRLGRVKGGECTGCGYDLRASGGPCPECGAGPIHHEALATGVGTAAPDLPVKAVDGAR